MQLPLPYYSSLHDADFNISGELPNISVGIVVSTSDLYLATMFSDVRERVLNRVSVRIGIVFRSCIQRTSLAESFGLVRDALLTRTIVNANFDVLQCQFFIDL